VVDGHRCYPSCHPYGLTVIPSDASIWWLVIILLMVVVWEFVAVAAAWMSGGVMASVVIGGILLTPMILLFPVNVGAVTFRLMGIGGGIPISAVARLPDDSLDNNLRRVQGCLVMWLGNQLSIQIPLDMKRGIVHCHFSPLTPVHENGETVPTMVHTLRRDDVLDISSIGFPSKH
jgi:hypothetical protein